MDTKASLIKLTTCGVWITKKPNWLVHFISGTRRG